MSLANQHDAFPTVASDADRNLRFPNPADGFKVRNRGSGWVEEYDGTTWQRVLRLDPRTVGLYDVQVYGALGDGTTDDRVAIQAALDAAGTAGGGVVQLGVGTYRVSKTNLRADASLKVCLEVPSKVTLRGMGRGATTIKLLGSTAVSGLNIVFNKAPATFADRDIVVEDLTIDGDRVTVNALGTVTATNGITTTRVTNLTVQRVRVTALHDTGNGPPNEGFAISPNLADGFVIDDCTVDSGAAGVGCNGSASTQAKHGRITNVYVTDARAMGFTLYDADDVTHVNCHVHTAGTNISSHGFNTESSRNVRYVGCTARSAAFNGFAVHAGAYGTQHIGCTASGCYDGFAYIGDDASDWLDSNGQAVGSGFGTGANQSMILGGTAMNNTHYGVAHERGTLRGVLPNFYGNTTATLATSSGTAPGERQLLGTEGLRLDQSGKIMMRRPSESGERTLLERGASDEVLFRNLGASGQGWYFRDQDGNNCVQIMDGANTTANKTALFVRKNIAGVFALVQVEVGAADSGGAGFRMLRVVN